MNQDLLNDLSNPSFDTDEAEQIMHRAGQEIIRLENRIKELNQYNQMLRNEIEKLSLDLGLKNYPYLSNH